MINRRSVWKKLKQEGILDSNDPKVIEWVTYMRDNPKKCWTELIPVYRSDFYDTFDTIVPVLVGMKDPVVNAALLRNLDTGKSNELDTLSAIADTSDPGKDPLTFKRLAKLGNNKINKRLNSKALPTSIKTLLKSVKEPVVKAPVVKAPTVKAAAVKSPAVKKPTIKKSTAVKAPSAKAVGVKKAVAKKGVIKKKPTSKK